MRDRTFEGRRLEQTQSRIGRASSYWNGHSKLSGSNASAPSYPKSLNSAHSVAPLMPDRNLSSSDLVSFRISNVKPAATEREREREEERQWVCLDRFGAGLVNRRCYPSLVLIWFFLWVKLRFLPFTITSTVHLTVFFFNRDIIPQLYLVEAFLFFKSPICSSILYVVRLPQLSTLTN